MVDDTTMTWKDLIKKAKELGYEYDEDKEELKNCDAYFYKIGGEIYNSSFDLFARQRTPSQMYQIILSLED